jgi:hypothetical protein
MMDAFISHASEDKPIARRLERDLTKAHLRVWIDHANIRVGDPLADSIQEAIENTTSLVLLWSISAAESRYVKFEWQAAIHLSKPVIPCQLDHTELPVFLRTILFCDFQGSYAQGRRKLIEALGGVLPPPPAQPQIRQAPLAQRIAYLVRQQDEVMDQLAQYGSMRAAKVQAQLDADMEQALRTAGDDPMILNLAGFHKKNAYMIKHWAAIQNHETPQDALLEESERFFYAALSIQPDDLSALNGLGSVLILRHDLDAAEFFIRRALVKTQAQGLSYSAAEHDLQLVLRMKKKLQQ